MKAKLLALIACLFPLVATAGGGFFSGQVPGLTKWWTFNTDTKGTNAAVYRFWRDVYNITTNSFFQNPGPTTSAGVWTGADGVDYWVAAGGGAVSTKLGDYLFCNGIPQSVTTTNATPVTGTGATWSIWFFQINVNNPNAIHAIVSMQGDPITGIFANNRFLFIYEQLSGQIVFQIFNVVGAGNGTYIGRTSPGSTMSNRTWYHVVCTWDGGITTASQKIYINGSRVDTADASSGVFSVPLPVNGCLQVGTDVSNNMIGSGGGFYPIGTFDDFRIYNRPLTTNEIRLLYGAGYGSQH